MKFTKMIGAEVVSPEGEHLGRLLDLRCERGESGPEYATVSAIVFGKVGWLERLGFLAVKEQTAAWHDIERFGMTKIVLRSRDALRSPRNT
jgi:hypothetical protein